jgi:FtsZ-binding cell division protein ZapB
MQAWIWICGFIWFWINLNGFINMNENSPTDFSSITSSLKIDEAIQRSRKVMEESKALTYKNSQKKSLIDEKLKNMISLGPEVIEPFKHLESPRLFSEIAETPKVTYAPLPRDDLQLELKNLNNKISSQMTQIRLLEMNISELKVENSHLIDENRQLKQRHKQEIQYLTDMYEEKLRNSQPSNNFMPVMEKRLKELEENFRRQVGVNIQLEQKIEELGKVNFQRTKIMEIEKEFENNQETISKFQDKLEKAKKILGDNVSPKGVEKKMRKVKSKEKVKKKKKLSKEF